MGRKNVADGNDRVAVQAGQVLGKKNPKADSPKTDTSKSGRTENVRSGNARVGRQVDEIRGGLSF